MLNRDIFKKLIFHKYRIKKLIHSSGFASVYEGINEKENIPVALKLEKKNTKYNVLESEAFILMNIKGYGIPKILSFGRHGLYNVLIEELLGFSLGNIFDKLKSHKFNLKDICMVALQCLDRLEYIHSKNVVHRDIKPANFVIGKSDPNVIYLIDFGLSRKFRSSRTGKHIKFNNLKLTYGSLRYLSINGNKGYEQSRRDDLESLGYMIIFLVTGNLPWIDGENIDINIVKKYLLIYKIKKKISTEKLCEGLPEEMMKYMDYCKGLYFEQDPNYDYLRSLFETILIKNKLKNDLKFCWISKTILNQEENRAQAQSQGKNKKRNKKSESPHIRLLNIIENNLKKEKNKKLLNKSLSNTNIFIKKEENSKNTEKDHLNMEAEYKSKIKNQQNLDNESTKEKDIKGINTDKSQSTSCDKIEKLNIKKSKNLKFNNDKIIMNDMNDVNDMNPMNDMGDMNDINNIIDIKIDEQRVNNETDNNLQNLKNIKIIDDEKCKIYEFNYQNTNNENNSKMNYNFEKNKIIDKLEDIHKDRSDINYKKVDIINKNKKDLDRNLNKVNVVGLKSPDKNKKIKFLSGEHFWDEDIEDETKNKYNTFNNFDLHIFDISNYNPNEIVINKKSQAKLNKYKTNPNKLNIYSRNPNNHNNNKKFNYQNIKNTRFNNNNINNYNIINSNNSYNYINIVTQNQKKLNYNKELSNVKKNNYIKINIPSNRIVNNNNLKKEFNNIDNCHYNIKNRRNKEYLALSNNTRKYNTLLNFNLYNFLPTNRRIIEPINQRNNKNFTNQNIYEMNSNMKNNINQRLTNIKNAYLIPQNISQNNFGGIKYPNYTEPINMI